MTTCILSEQNSSQREERCNANADPTLDKTETDKTNNKTQTKPLHSLKVVIVPQNRTRSVNKTKPEKRTQAEKHHKLEVRCFNKY